MSVAEIIDPSGGRLPFDARPAVLIVEDQMRLRERLVHQVMELGIMPAVATKGTDAVRLVKRERHDLILLDGLLPDMHGFEVARILRALDPAYRPRIAIVTGIYKGTRYENEARLKYGVDNYILKPVSHEALANVVWQARRIL